jgi:hypothetical protein
VLLCTLAVAGEDELKLFLLGSIAAILLSSPAVAQCANAITVCRADQDNVTNKAPGCVGGNVSQKSDVEAAIKLAPSLVRAELCLVEKFFVTGGSSFGFWENPYSGQDHRSRTYIGVNESVFNQTLAQEETTLVRSLLENERDKLNLNYDIQPKGGVNEKHLAILAVLAHELAHIRWYRWNVFAEPCYQQAFSSKTWDKIDDAFQRKWVAFNEEKGTLKNKSLKRPKEVNDKKLAKDFLNLYKEFASPFGVVSPEEDYVETYKLATIWPNFTARRGSSEERGRDFNVFKVTVDTDTGTYTLDIKDLNEPDLEAKLRCVWLHTGAATVAARRKGSSQRRSAPGGRGR